MSGVHLFSGDQLAEARYFPGGYVAVCGALLRPHSASGTDEEPRYCPVCVRAAVRWNAEADTSAVGVR